MQESNVPSPHVKGKIQLSQPVSIGYVGSSPVAVHAARNPARVPPLLDLNVRLSVLVLLMMLHGWEIDPQCFDELSSSIQPSEHAPSKSRRISKCRNVSLILCPSSTPSANVYQIKTIVQAVNMILQWF